MKVAIIGSNGFIGSYLVKTLSKNHTVLPVTRQTVDIANYASVQHWLGKNRPDVVVNCAISGGGPAVNDINYSHVQHDLTAFLNFYNSGHAFRYINIGSGAEFDRRTDISSVCEDEIVNRCPVESYGFVKNTIARMCLDRDNFYTLRLFGCFDSSEPDFRLFKRFRLTNKLNIVDRYFDFISLRDFATIVEYYLIGINPKDMNCVYEDKMLLSDQLNLFAKYQVPYGELVWETKLDKSYTGDGNKLAALDIKLLGLEESIRQYE